MGTTFDCINCFYLYVSRIGKKGLNQSFYRINRSIDVLLYKSFVFVFLQNGDDVFRADLERRFRRRLRRSSSTEHLQNFGSALKPDQTDNANCQVN